MRMDLAADQVQGLPALLAAEAEQADAGGGDEADGREAGEVLPGSCQGDGPVKQQEAGHQEGDQQRPVVGVAQKPEHVEPELTDDFYYFPASGKARDVANAFLHASGAEVRTRAEVVSIDIQAGKTSGVTLADGEFLASEAVILAAGGTAWSGLGSEEYLYVDSQYLHAGTIYTDNGTAIGTVSGASYDKTTNTLTLNNFTGGVIDANLLGNGFKIELIGENSLDYICIWGAMYGGSVTFTGSGSIKINENQNLLYWKD